MSENAKTLIFVGLAVAAGLAGWVTRPTPIKVAPAEAAGMVELFPNLKDPRKVKALEIVEFDEQTAQQRVFEVKQVKGIWSIPSHRNYPADANRQMADAAAAVLDLKRLGTAVPSSSGRYTREDHERYGVLDPGAEDLEVGMTGVGKRVTLKDAQGKELAKFIIGKSDPQKPEIRFLRIPGQDLVYKVEIDTHPLSTKFEDWIEKDLLKLNAFDIKRITVSDYSVDRLSGRVDLRSTFTVEYKDTKWSLVEMRVRSDEPLQEIPELSADAQPSLDLVFRTLSKPRGLADDEELDTTKLSDMRMALDDLKIVDVHRKPDTLAEAIRAGRGMRITRLDDQSLSARGFQVHELQFGPLRWTELLSSEGEVRVGMNDGVEYLLRFGTVAGREQEDEEEAASKKKQAKQDGKQDDSDTDLANKEDDDSPGGLTRFLMVVAQYNPDLIPPPQLPPLPDGDDAEGETDGNEADGEKAGGENADGQKAEGQADDADSSSGESEEEQDADADAQSDQAKAKSKSAKKRKTKQETERERVQKERDRLQKEYDDKVKKAKDRVAELNRRFAEWYYVINENTYRKIHLSYQDIIKKKTASAGSSGTSNAPQDHADHDHDDADARPAGSEDMPSQDAPDEGDAEEGAGDNATEQPADPDGNGGDEGTDEPEAGGSSEQPSADADQQGTQ